MNFALDKKSVTLDTVYIVVKIAPKNESEIFLLCDD